MASIEETKKVSVTSGAATIQVNSALSEHHLYFSGATGDITLTVVGKFLDPASDGTNPGADGENVVAQGGCFHLSAGAINYVIVTPTALDAPYTVSVSSL